MLLAAMSESGPGADRGLQGCGPLSPRCENELPAGNTDRIISDGTSAGGALSVLLGSTGNDPRYLPYPEEKSGPRKPAMIFAAIVFCPITLLSHADEAYEWVFKDETVYHQGKIPAA